MARFTRKRRQAVIDGYLNATGRNIFHPGEFVDWLQGQTDHEAYPWFFSSDDATTAREHRIALARQMASGLRIVANIKTGELAPGGLVTVEVREFPAFISPVGARAGGGGYHAFDPTDPALVTELRRQAATALLSWLARYQAVAEMGGIDVSPIVEIAAGLDGGGVANAA